MLHPYYYFKNIFSPEECRIIIEMHKKYVIDGQVNKNNTESVNLSKRKSKITWVKDDGIRTKLTKIFAMANADSFGVEVDYNFPYDIQFTEYSEGGYYGDHIDAYINPKSMYDRKLSVTVPLSIDSEVEGGSLEFFIDGEWKSAEMQQQGTAIVFPSFSRHKVNPVIKGTRYSLVAWLQGPKWK